MDEPRNGEPHASLRETLPVLIDTASEQLPGMARIAAGAWWRSTVWTVGATRRTGRLVLRSVTDPDASSQLVEEVARDVAEAARVISNVARRVQDGTPITAALAEGVPILGVTVPGTVLPDDHHDPHRYNHHHHESHDDEDLRARGARLLERSRDVWAEDDTHPAFGRILDDLAPDEARILLLLAKGGPQPSVDVRTGGPVGMVSSQLIAPGLNMLGARSGVRYLDRVPAYLNNLDRLGLVWLSHESVTDPMEYQVLEAQPDVLTAMHSVRFAKVLRRSIHLTPFGEDFCRTCLLEPEDAEDLPAHQVPPERDPDDS
ncbi:Abi-alpha family protein [Nocardioides guangzhouensis]|nr:Abi-alpha family protein [Nocardioides guangzhouensis]